MPVHPATRTRQRSWPDRLAMTAVFVANGLAFGAWAGNIPRVKEAAGLADGPLGLVLLCVSLGAVGAMPLAGRYAARIGTARACWLAALVLAAALPVPALSPSFAGLLVSGVGLGLGLGLLDVCMNAHAAAMERRWGAAIMSSFHAGWSVGQLAGAALAGLLAAVALAPGMGVAAAAVAALGLAALRLPELAPVAEERTRLGRPSRAVVGLGVIVAASFAVEGGTADWSGVYLRTVLDVSPALASSSLAVFAASMVAMRLVGDALVRRLGPVRVVAAGGAVAAAGWLLVLAAPWVSASGVAGAGLGFALVGAGVANIVPVAFSAAGRLGAAGVSMVATAGYGAAMAAPPLIGFVAQETGLRAALLLLVLAAAVMVGLARRVGGADA